MKPEMTTKCYLLESLPAEFRVQIYEHVFNEPNTHPLLIIKDELKIKVKQKARAHVGLHKTCETIHYEATPVAYESQKFYVEIACYRSHSNPRDSLARHASKQSLIYPPYTPHVRSFNIWADMKQEKDDEAMVYLTSAFAGAVAASDPNCCIQVKMNDCV
ncbi:uncharacterized protein LTR77_002648 [Saxophila tyrrhenica]|uniref:Uncharacterized protein n=1 Tax=Saxophila tyrrhenica TaxID=1690608 RepID=A0AAV9PGV7_9PEZI|nr:hypothetical protein LTR77_002648 [Saxophila tyrrhenica]